MSTIRPSEAASDADLHDGSSLSYAAKGVLAYLMVNRRKEVTFGELVALGPDGEDEIIAALAELKDQGLLAPRGTK